MWTWMSARAARVATVPTARTQPRQVACGQQRAQPLLAAGRHPVGGRDSPPLLDGWPELRGGQVRQEHDGERLILTIEVPVTYLHLRKHAKAAELLQNDGHRLTSSLGMLRHKLAALIRVFASVAYLELLREPRQAGVLGGHLPDKRQRACMTLGVPLVYPRDTPGANTAQSTALTPFAARMAVFMIWALADTPRRRAPRAVLPQVVHPAI